MRLNLSSLCRWLLVFAVAAGLTVSSSAGGQGRATTVALRADGGPYAIVALRVNGMGPYEFVVDSGSSVTLIGAGLSRELGLKSERAVTMSSVSGAKSVGQTTAMVAVGTIAVRGLQVDIVDGLDQGVFGAGVRGVLGENFLGMFDVLLDNEMQRMTLDPDGGLTSGFDGERLAMEQTTTFNGRVMHFRPTISVVVPEYSRRPLRLILDTGSAALFISKRIGFAHSGVDDHGGRAEVKMLHTPVGVTPCASWSDEVQWGKMSMKEVPIASCPAVTAMDSEGSMPTFVFKRVLISHQGGYVVVNPERRAAGMVMALAGSAGAR